MNYKQLYAIKNANKEKILKVCPKCPNTSGIYFLTREEDGFKWSYIGKAKHLLSRLADHLSGYQHIDLSLRKHGLYNEENQVGWKVNFLEFPEYELDQREQYFIKLYAQNGYQLRNHESGGTNGKVALETRRSNRGYYDGLSQGYKNAQKYVADLFAKHLDYKPKKEPPTKLQEKAMQKFKDFLGGDDE
jgi:hypothetical protein